MAPDRSFEKPVARIGSTHGGAGASDDRSTQVTYWEGAIESMGTSGGKPITGLGYMELTGYAERFTKKL